MITEIMNMIETFYSAEDEFIIAANIFLSDYYDYDKLSSKDIDYLKEQMKKMIVRGTDE